MFGRGAPSASKPMVPEQVIPKDYLIGVGSLGPWATLGLVSWVVLLLTLPISIVALAPASFLTTLHLSPSMHSLVEGFCSAAAFEIFGILIFAAFYRRDLSIFLFSLAFLTMGLLDALHAGTSSRGHPLFFVTLHTASSLCGAVLLVAAVSLRVWSIRAGRVTKPSHLLIVAGLCAIAALAYHAVILQLGIGRNPAANFSALTYRIHNISTACYVLSAAGLLYYYWITRYVPALVIGSMVVAMAESAYLFGFSTMWDLNWWMWHFVKAAFYFGMLTTASIAFVFTIRSVETSRLALARTNLKLTRTKRKLAEFNSELHARNEMVREAAACFSVDNVLHAFSHAIMRIVPECRCEIVIHVAPDEVGESNRIFRSEWGTPWITAEPFPNRIRPEGEESEGLRIIVPPNPIGLFAFPLVSERVEFGLVRIQMTAPGAGTHNKIRAAVREIGPLVQSSLRNFHLVNEAKFRKTLTAAVGKACSSLDAARVLMLACQEIIALIDADWACIVNRSLAVLASTSDSSSVPDEVLRAEHLAGGRRNFVDDPQIARRWSGESWTAMSLPFSHNESGDLVLVVCRRRRVEFSTSSISKGELFVRQLAVAYSNAVNYRRVVDMNRELEVQREIRARSERLATLGQLAACVAHEVRNPLGAITNCISILGHDRSDQGTVDNVLEIIRGEVARLDRLTRDFLAIGSRPSKISVVRLDEMLDRVTRAVQQYISYERLSVRLDPQFAGEGTALLFDSDGLEIVLWNLVLNAVQAVSGAGRVQVVLRQRSEHIFLAVIDNGRGIAADDRQIIFEPFLSTRASGAGLGLVIVSRYVTQWGGKIKLKSTVGRGSAFLMRIPLPSAVRNTKQSA